MRAVVFDLDGVLVDSEPVWDRVRRAYVAERGGRWLPDSQRRVMGMSTAEWSAYLTDEVGVPGPPEQVASDVVAAMGRAYDAGIPLLPGAGEAVRQMAGAAPLGLASSSPRALIDRVLLTTGWGPLFAVTRSTEEVGRGKPAPDVYLDVVAALGVAPADAVAVEDSTNCIRAALAAGL
ncbi:MAG TPA: HAD family phosphatase, partial [Jiangellales bacterium]|nr:HAD family phosphatase [Jiangellales bacterium]